MASSTEPNVISDDGLRYARGKSNVVVPNAQLGAMSCFKCGRFKTAADMVSKRFFGTNQRICKGGCEPK